MGGVEDAAEETKDMPGVMINPPQQANIPDKASTGQGRQARTIRYVDFDVAITVTETDQSGGGGKLAIAGIGISGKLSSATETSAVSRLRFQIPVLYPG